MRPALFRALQRLVFGYTGSQRQHLSALAEKVGAPPPAFDESVTHGDAR